MIPIACNCGGRSGARATRTGTTTNSQTTYWRHTDEYGGVVPYWNEEVAHIALARTKGRLDKVDRTGNVVETITYQEPKTLT